MVFPRIEDAPFRDALISQWRDETNARLLIDVLLEADKRLFIDPINNLMRGLDIDSLSGVLLDFAGYQFGIRRPLVDTGASNRVYFGFAGVGNTPLTGSFDEAPMFSQNAFFDSFGPMSDERFRALVKLAAFRAIGVKTNEKCMGALRTVYPTGYIVDNQNLSVVFHIDDSVLDLASVITEFKLWPKPAGVSHTVNAI